MLRKFLENGHINKARLTNVEVSAVTDLDLLSEDPVAVAGQLCHLDYESLRAIPVQELLSKRFNEESTSPNFHKMVNSWNKRTLWVLTEILKKEKATKRAQVVHFFIKVADALKSLNNYQ